MSADKTVLECWVIIIILGVAAYMFIRSHKKVWAGSVLPLMLVPFINIIYSPINRKIMEYNHSDAYSTRIIIYLVAFAAVCVWASSWGRKLPAGRTKYTYIIVSIAFTFILILIFLRDLVFRPYFRMWYANRLRQRCRADFLSGIFLHIINIWVAAANAFCNTFLSIYIICDLKFKL